MVLPSDSVPLEVQRITEELSEDSTDHSKRNSTKQEFLRGRGLEITWSSGEKVLLDSGDLRTHCPCAECLGKKTSCSLPQAETRHRPSLQVISATIEEETNLVQVWPIGNYALGIRWGDRHDSGIYTYDLLRKLCAEQLKRRI